jgi:hypothetical protein
MAAQLDDLDLDEDDQLAADLTAPKYSYDLKMRRVVETKDDMKKRLKRSPDRGDGVMLTLVQAESPGAIVRPPARQRGEPGPLSDDDLLTAPM